LTINPEDETAVENIRDSKAGEEEQDPFQNIPDVSFERRIIVIGQCPS
jgi:hypothetical protein